MADQKQLILVDGSSYLYRAFHALPSFSNSTGEATGAVYGMVNMLRRLMKDHSTKHFAVIFDAKGKTFRDDIYSEYKANRPPMPGDLRSQIERVHEVVRAMGIPLLEVPGVEADDVIGTLAIQGQEQNFEVLMVSGDKDLAQLVDHQVKMVDTMREVTYDRDGIEKKFGVPPEMIIDYLALVGDTSDNVPGVPKVGPKTAVKWLHEYGTVDSLVEHADEIGGKIGENLRASVDQLPLSQQLVTIKCDVELKEKPGDLLLGEPDEAALRDLFATLEFKTWLKELGGLDKEKSGQEKVTNYELVTSKTQLNVWIKRLKKADVFAFDTETTSLDAMRAELVGLSFSDAPGQAAYVPVAHDYEGVPKQLSRDDVLSKLKPLLEDPKQKKVGQNLKYDHMVLCHCGIDMQGIEYDTMLESYVIDSTATRHDMDSLALKYLGHKTISFEEVTGKGKAQVTFDKVPLEKATDYASEDADVTLKLHHVLWPKLEAEPTLKKLFQTVELPLLTVLSRIEQNGVRVDADMLHQQSQELAASIEALESKAHDLAGQVFNIGSPKQIQEILFDKLQLPVISKTPKGQPSTAENVLQELAVDYELPDVILEYRGLSKLKSTYTDKLPELINPRTNRLHTSYHQAVAATGRLSSADPNLQNIPVRTAEGRRIREAFVPADGCQLVSVDYSQIELRIMAHLSKDEGLVRAFAEGADVHRATAAEVFGVTPKKVTDDQRRSAKAINFGLIYGMSAFGLARQLKIDRSSAQKYVNLYFERYPGVKRFMDETRALAHERKYVETVYGRRLYLPEINSSNHVRRQYAERTAINAPMQGTAADIIKLAMLKVDEWILQKKVDTKVILQVHDELVLEVRKSAIKKVTKELPGLMTSVADLSVPLEVDLGIGNNWAEAHS